MTEGPPLNSYRQRLEEITASLRQQSSLHRWLSFARLAIFILAFVFTYLATGWGTLPLVLVPLAGISLFLVAVRWHLKVGEVISHLENLRKINEDEIRALGHDFSSFDGGGDFSDPEHPYSSDLDIFGEGSLFQFLNRTSTFRGKELLASWLKRQELDPAVITSRQDSTEELARHLVWRQEFRATGYEVKEQKEDADELMKWIDEPAEFHRPVVLFWLLFIPALAAAAITLVSTGTLPAIVLLFFIFISLSVSAKYKRLIDIKHRQLGKRAAIIEKYSQLLSLIEEKEFGSELLKETRSLLGQEGIMPGRRVRKLSGILNAFDTRLNLVAGFLLNVLFLWDVIQARRLESWIASNREHLPRWISAVALIDALASFANYRFNFPGTVFPKVQEGPFIIEGEGLGHPIIPGHKLVSNPLSISGLPEYHIITGANMAGKSTYLRTVGVNLVLAMAGGPVLAGSFVFTPLKVMTSIRTSDSLVKNESYFYAELKHLSKIVETLGEGERIFILLDEILKGTNSKDKQSGSEALMRKLLGYSACGLIATHDLSLGELEREYPGKINNKSFEVVIRDDRLVFDYKLRDGVARQMNATFLMKKMGIT